jgi:multidrug efflux system membrane fusion protein
MSVACFRRRSSTNGQRRRWRWRGALALWAAILAVGCGQTPAAKEKTIEVVVTTPITDDMVDYQDFTGRMDAFRTVDVRSRVTGYVDVAFGADGTAPFKEGDRVKKGDVLFEIDPRPYQVVVDQVTADLATRKAETVRAEALYKRTIDLVRTKAATMEDIDKQKGDWDVARASIQQAEAKLSEAKLNLSFCRVIAPMTGRISQRKVDPGNLVKADDTLLTTIVADDQVYAYFDVDERTYLDLVGENPTASPSERVKDLKLPVLMRLANGEEFTYRGYVDFLDCRLNGNTGTIRMRAEFNNPRDSLKAGLFVRVRLPIGTAHQAQLISDEALQSDQGRKYVFVVNTVTEKKDDGTEETKDIVEYRPVMLGQAIQRLREIKPATKDKEGKIVEGLLPGERVIVSGMQRVRAKTQVHATMQDPPKPPGFPLEKLLSDSKTKNGPLPRLDGKGSLNAP